MTIKATRPGGIHPQIVNRLMKATQGHINPGSTFRDPHAPIADNDVAADLNHKVRMERTNRGLFG